MGIEEETKGDQLSLVEQGRLLVNATPQQRYFESTAWRHRKLGCKYLGYAVAA